VRNRARLLSGVGWLQSGHYDWYTMMLNIRDPLIICYGHDEFRHLKVIKTIRNHPKFNFFKNFFQKRGVYF
jgi:hypothetical protein